MTANTDTLGALPTSQTVSTRRHSKLRFAVPTALTIAVLAGALFPLNPIISLCGHDAAAVATLRYPVAYVLTAPLSMILDFISLLSPEQAWATFGLIAAIAFVVKRRRQQAKRIHFFSGDTALFTLRLGFATLGVLELVLVAPRPMAAIQLRDPALLTVDFHSHTAASHDGRYGFDDFRNREWHQSAGFDVAYVTDHRTFAGAIAANQHNPVSARFGTVLLPGVELRDFDEHVILLGADPSRSMTRSPDLAKAEIVAKDSDPPVLILSLPGNDRRIPLSESHSNPILRAIELSDGSPRGLQQTSADRERILGLASSRSLATVAGSDNHGWGRVAPAWTVLRIPGWRDMPIDTLDRRIRRAVVKGQIVDVIARQRVAAAPTLAIGAASGIAVGILLFRNLDWAQRISGIVWSWSLAVIFAVRVPSHLFKFAATPARILLSSERS